MHAFNAKSVVSMAQIEAPSKMGLLPNIYGNVFGSPLEAPVNLKLAFLNSEHDALDSAISMLSAATYCDDYLIARLKKRKLQIKDEIVALGLMSVSG